MKSPFPGMDPFVEACGYWGDFHSHLIERIYERLTDTVPSHYEIRTDQRAYVVVASENGEKKHSFIPDVGVTSSATQTGVAVAELATADEPIPMRAFVEESFRETFIEIRSPEGEGHLVTCIEILSPSNKRAGSPGWDLYQRKRQGLLLGRAASLIEFDLLRGGQRMPMTDAWPTSPYTILVGRQHLLPNCRVWPAYSQRRLPTIPVPLCRPDADVQLDIQPLVDAVIARARYPRVDYTKALTPPLNASELECLKKG